MVTNSVANRGYKLGYKSGGKSVHQSWLSLSYATPLRLRLHLDFPGFSPISSSHTQGHSDSLRNKPLQVACLRLCMKNNSHAVSG